jgi:acetyltransferase-like isoleucine patch superfamily enzyme
MPRVEPAPPQHVSRIRRKRLLNGVYVWGMHWFHLILDLLPAPLRSLLWRPLLGKCGRGVMIDHKVYFKYPWLVELADDISINRGVEFYPGMVEKARIRIGSGVRIAPNARLHAAAHDPDDPLLRESAADIVVGDHAWLGAAAIILPGVRIGEGAVVAAGAVVTADVPSGAIVAGVPARIVRMRQDVQP